MIVFFICSRTKIFDTFESLSIYYTAFSFLVIRTAETGNDAAFVWNNSRVYFLAKIFCKLCLVDLIITAKKYDNLGIVFVELIHYGLAGFLDSAV